MRSPALGMRWWLAALVAGIVALTAVSVAEILLLRSERAFRERAEELAAGSALTASNAIAAEDDLEAMRRAAATASSRRRIAIFLFDGEGALLTNPSSNGVSLASVPALEETVNSILEGRRDISSAPDASRIVVGLPIRNGPAAGLVAVASRPDLTAAGDIVRGQLGVTVLLAVGGGALIGAVAAIFITSRVRRIGRAAAEIEQGNFDRSVQLRFNDELSQLARTVDGMRVRLKSSFESLEAERDRLRSLLEQLQEGVIAVDRDVRVLFANSRARLMLGSRLLEPGQPLPEPLPGVALAELAGRLFEPGAAIETARVRMDGERTYSIAGVPLREPGQFVLLVLTDVSVADRRERAEREFVSNAAHELRTPLAAIASAMDALASGAKETPRERDAFLAVVDRQSKRLERLVHALLALARFQTRSEPIKIEPVDVSALLTEVVTELRSSSDIPIELACPAGLTVDSHYDLLSQAVGNLAANAVKHANGGPVQISADMLPAGTVCIDVRDHGEGISALDRERVFDRFYRSGARTSEGFGLGLSIAREVAGALGGEVKIEPTEDGGTRASITVGPTARMDSGGIDNG